MSFFIKMERLAKRENSVKMRGMPDFFLLFEYKEYIAKLQLVAKPELIEILV